MAIVKVRQGYHSYTNSLWSAHLSQPSLGSESMKVLIPGLTARPTGGRGVRDLLSRLELPTGTKSPSFVPIGNEGLLAPIGTKRLLFYPDRCYPSWCYQSGLKGPPRVSSKTVSLLELNVLCRWGGKEAIQFKSRQVHNFFKCHRLFSPGCSLDPLVTGKLGQHELSVLVYICYDICNQNNLAGFYLFSDK